MLLLQQRLSLYARIIKLGLLPTTVFSNNLIHLFSNNAYLPEARRLFDAMPHPNIFSWNAIIHAHIKNNDLSEARLLFHSAPIKDSVTYNSMISGLSSNEHDYEALQLFKGMQRSGSRVDEFTLTTMLNLAAKISAIQFGKQVHSLVVKTGSDSNCFGISSLIDMYSKCGSFLDAFGVFGEAGEEDSVSNNAMVAACCREGELKLAFDLFWRAKRINDTMSWNTIISGCVQNDAEYMALELFVQMGEEGSKKNEHTFASILSACASLRSLKHGKEVHAYVLKNGLISNPFISSGIVDLYCKCDNLEQAETVYKEIRQENVFSTTSMITGHAGRGNTVEARRLFDKLEEKNSIVWTAMFSCYLKLRQTDEVFKLFRDLVEKEMECTDTLILVNVLGACALQADLDHGKQIHSYILRMAIEMDEKLASATADMYAKCGNIKHSEEVFRKIGARDRVLYNAMISGFALNGRENEALALFEEMTDIGIRPDGVTFIALLSACRHAGLVETGEKYFASMFKDYRIPLEIDHCSCIVDLFGRANQLDKALKLIKDLPFKADGIIWGTFLNACKINKNIEMAKEAEEQLLHLDANNGARYVQLANVYAAEGRWSEMGKIRRIMREREVKRVAGCSWIYVANEVNIFISGDKFHAEGKAIHEMLANLNMEMGEEFECEIGI